MIVGLSAVLTLVLFVFKREILTRFGASEAILPYAESYFYDLSAGNGLCAAFDRNEPVYYLPGICADRNDFGGARCGNEYCAGSSVYFLCLTWAWRGRRLPRFCHSLRRRSLSFVSCEEIACFCGLNLNVRR